MHPPSGISSSFLLKITEDKRVDPATVIDFPPFFVDDLLKLTRFEQRDHRNKLITRLNLDELAHAIQTVIKKKNGSSVKSWTIVGSVAAYQIFIKLQAFIFQFLDKEKLLNEADIYNSDDFDLRIELDSSLIDYAEDILIEAIKLINPKVNASLLSQTGWERRKLVCDSYTHAAFIALGDRKSRRLDITFFSRLEPKILFSRDAAHIDITDAIERGGPAKVVTNGYHPLQPFLDRLNRIIRIPEPEKVNEFGFPLLIYYLSKGYRLADPSQEAILLDTFKKRVPEDKRSAHIDHVLHNHPLEDNRAFKCSFLVRLGLSPDDTVLPDIKIPFKSLKCIAYLMHPDDPHIEVKGKKWYVPEPTLQDIQDLRKLYGNTFSRQHIVSLVHREGKNPLTSLPRKALLQLIRLSHFDENERKEMYYTRVQILSQSYPDYLFSRLEMELYQCISRHSLQIFTLLYRLAIKNEHLMGKICDGACTFILPSKNYHEILTQLLKLNRIDLSLKIIRRMSALDLVDNETCESFFTLLHLSKTAQTVKEVIEILRKHKLSEKPVLDNLEEDLEALFSEETLNNLYIIFGDNRSPAIHRLLLNASIREEKWRDALLTAINSDSTAILAEVLITKGLYDWVLELLRLSTIPNTLWDHFLASQLRSFNLKIIQSIFALLPSEKIAPFANQVLDEIESRGLTVDLRTRENLAPFFLQASPDRAIPFLTKYPEAPFTNPKTFIRMGEAASYDNQIKLFKWCSVNGIDLRGMRVQEIPYSDKALDHLKFAYQADAISREEAINRALNIPEAYSWLSDLIQGAGPRYLEEHFDEWPLDIRLGTYRALPSLSYDRATLLVSETRQTKSAETLCHLIQDPKMPAQIVEENLHELYLNGIVDRSFALKHPPQTLETFIVAFKSKSLLNLLYPLFFESLKKGLVTCDLSSFMPIFEALLTHHSPHILSLLEPPLNTLVPANRQDYIEQVTSQITDPKSPLLEIIWEYARASDFTPPRLLKLMVQGPNALRYVEATGRAIHVEMSPQLLREFVVLVIQNFDRFEESLVSLNKVFFIIGFITAKMESPPKLTILNAFAGTRSKHLLLEGLTHFSFFLNNLDKPRENQDTTILSKFIIRAVTSQDDQIVRLGENILNHKNSINLFSATTLRSLWNELVIARLKMAVSGSVERKKEAVNFFCEKADNMNFKVPGFFDTLGANFFDLVITFIPLEEFYEFNRSLIAFHMIYLVEKGMSLEELPRYTSHLTDKTNVVPSYKFVTHTNEKQIGILRLSLILYSQLLQGVYPDSKTYSFVHNHIRHNIECLANKNLGKEAVSVFSSFLYFFPATLPRAFDEHVSIVKPLYEKLKPLIDVDRERAFEIALFFEKSYQSNNLEPKKRVECLHKVILRFSKIPCEISCLKILRLLRVYREDWKKFALLPMIQDIFETVSVLVKKYPFEIVDGITAITCLNNFIAEIVGQLSKEPGKAAPFATLHLKSLAFIWEEHLNNPTEYNLILRLTHGFLQDSLNQHAFMNTLVTYYALVENLSKYYLKTVSYVFHNRMDPVSHLLTYYEPRPLTPLEKTTRAHALIKWLSLLFEQTDNRQLIPHHIVNNFPIVKNVFKDCPSERIKYLNMLKDRNILPEFQYTEEGD